MTYDNMVKMIKENDYIHIDTIDGIDFYTPNDEDWGAIVAVSHEHHLVKDTEFFEMDDMEAGEDYTQVIHEGEIKCRFETES